MDKGKIKNIIILVLLTVNLFFAALMLVNGAESRSYAAAAESSLTAALKSGGITISDSELLSQKSVPVCTFSRDKDRERRQVSSVLGSAEPSDLGGNIIMSQAIDREAVARVADDFKIVYTPFHGCGYKLVPEALKRLGIKHLYPVPEQMVIDGTFPTVQSPNPENPEGFYLAVDLAKKVGSDLIIGTDPDSDRIGVMPSTRANLSRSRQYSLVYMPSHLPSPHR